MKKIYMAIISMLLFVPAVAVSAPPTRVQTESSDQLIVQNIQSIKETIAMLQSMEDEIKPHMKEEESVPYKETYKSLINVKESLQGFIDFANNNHLGDTDSDSSDVEGYSSTYSNFANNAHDFSGDPMNGNRGLALAGLVVDLWNWATSDSADEGSDEGADSDTDTDEDTDDDNNTDTDTSGGYWNPDGSCPERAHC